VAVAVAVAVVGIGIRAEEETTVEAAVVSRIRNRNLLSTPAQHMPQRSQAIASIQCHFPVASMQEGILFALEVLSHD
jgi:hypothetical protein